MSVAAVLIRVLVIERAGSRIHLTADDRLDTGLFARFIEIDHTKHSAVVCNCARIHTELLYI